MTTGTNDLLANLTKLQLNNKSAARKAVDEGAQLFAKNLTANTPIGETGEMAASVEVSGFKGANQGLIEKDIGYNHAVGNRVHYPDTGTIYQSAQNFVEQTINQSTPQVQEIYREQIMKGLKL
ncbi:HK97-gp10 family putative phage morphogenesis protein [Carnobacterium antarcticum]|uniref:HK97-gp10 family putative phage morphogenesis protein n=1 Tax=Carnobacterium antarcticum TaxID=2126436 RepID=A0ABW4NMK4_9LACT|nr:HK97-gp10 family putative phage morphogenesis protein [Carnobacterium sp. CP1]ALV21060.1 Phage protein [Carnobacterium sp. CP1]